MPPRKSLAESSFTWFCINIFSGYYSIFYGMFLFLSKSQETANCSPTPARIQWILFIYFFIYECHFVRFNPVWIIKIHLLIHCKLWRILLCIQGSFSIDEQFIWLGFLAAETQRAPRPRRKRKSTNTNSSTPNTGMNSTSSKKKSPSAAGFTLATQDVMVVGEPSLMGGEFGDEDERLITRWAFEGLSGSGS